MGSTPKPSRSDVSILIFAILAAAILVGTVVYYLPRKDTPLNVSNTETSASVFSNDTGLQLILNIGNTTIISGQNETIYFQVYNTLNYANTMNYGVNYTNLPSSFRVSPGPCIQQPYGIAVIYGNLSINNLYGATSLQIYEPGIYTCPIMYHITNYQFLGHSSKAKVFSGTQKDGTVIFDETVHLSGSWSGDYSSHSFETFLPGAYTVVAADGWGQSVVLHFNVLP